MHLLRALAAAPADAAVASGMAASTAAGGDAHGLDADGVFLTTLTALLRDATGQQEQAVLEAFAEIDAEELDLPPHWPLALLSGLEVTAETSTGFPSLVDAPPQELPTALVDVEPLTGVEPLPELEADALDIAVPPSEDGAALLEGDDTAAAGPRSTSLIAPSAAEPTPSASSVDRAAGGRPADTLATASVGLATTSEPAPAADAAADGELEPASPATDRGPSSRAGSEPTDQTRITPPSSIRAASADGTSSGTGRTLGLADGVRRVLDAIELLENAPPPRQLTIDVGETRLRVALEDGHVRLTALDGAPEDVEELLRAAEDALADHGFDLDRRDRQDDQRDEEAPRSSDRSTPLRTRSTGRGLRL